MARFPPAITPWHSAILTPAQRAGGAESGTSWMARLDCAGTV